MSETRSDQESLDSFFAKKDKSNKKKGKKGKIVVSDLLPATTPTPPNEANPDHNNADTQVPSAEQVPTEQPEPVKEKKKSKKKRDKDSGDLITNEEDEWIEAVDETTRFDGLRIATINKSDEVPESTVEPEYDEHGQIIERPAEEAVWKIVASEPQQAAEPKAAAPAPVIAEMPNVSSDGKYVPPSRRGNAASQDMTPSVMKRNTGRRRQAPNMNSQEDFPTLGGPAPTVDYDISKFETVRHGSSSQGQSAASGPSRLETSNMYSALDRR